MAAAREVDPLTPAQRRALFDAPRPRVGLPVVPDVATPRKRLPLAPDCRDEDRQWRPVVAVWELTLRCDLSCRHCGSRAGKPRGGELTTPECLDVVRQLKDLGVREVSLIGGEAYLHDGWAEVVSAIHDAGMEVAMVTGGRGITPELAERAAQGGLASASVSIDGCEATHDRLRGHVGSHRSAIEALRNFRAAGVGIAVNTQINRLNVPDLPNILDHVAEAGAHSWQVALTVAMGRAADEPDVLLQPYDLLELFPLLASLKAKCDDVGVRFLAGNNIGYFGPHESDLRGNMPLGHLYSCGAGRSTLGIEADGTIKGCPSLPTEDWAGGNIRDNSLRDIWERAEPLRYTRDRTVDDLWGFCRSCYYAEECRAGCTWTSHVLFGKPGNNPYCHHRALEFHRKGKRETLVRVAAPPGLPFDFGRFAIVVEDA